MKKYVSAILFFTFYLTSNAQWSVSESDQIDIVGWFTYEWCKFRVQQNPVLNYGETHNPWGGWKNPLKIIGNDNFWVNYTPDVKIHNWDSLQLRQNLHNGSPPYNYARINTKGYYVLEKGNGLTGVKHPWKPKKKDDTDSITIHINDELFPYDNRFLVYYNSMENPKMVYYSGNVDWTTNEEFNGMYIEQAALMRGVQFGVERVWRMEEHMRDSLCGLRPNYSNYTYATAEASFLSYGNLLIGGPKDKEHLLIELIFYTNDPKKTGDYDKNNYYEMRYILPTIIKSISERRLEKRKLSPDELNLMWNSYLLAFLDKWYILTPEEEM